MLPDGSAVAGPAGDSGSGWPRPGPLAAPVPAVPQRFPAAMFSMWFLTAMASLVTRLSPLQGPATIVQLNTPPPSSVQLYMPLPLGPGPS